MKTITKMKKTDEDEVKYQREYYQKTNKKYVFNNMSLIIFNNNIMSLIILIYLQVFIFTRQFKK